MDPALGYDTSVSFGSRSAEKRRVADDPSQEVDCGAFSCNRRCADNTSSAAVATTPVIRVNKMVPTSSRVAIIVLAVAIR